MISLLPLQSTYYSTKTDWKTMAVFGGIIAAAIIFMAVYNNLSGTAQTSRTKKKYSRRAFKREALAIGLNKEQIKILENLIKVYQVRRPFNLLSNTKELNITLGKALRDIEHMEAPEAVIEQRKLALYRIKQHIDRNFADTNRLSNTKQLRLGQHITFQQENGNRFPSVITANLKEFYCAQVPINFGGEQVKWKKGSKIKLYIWGVDGEEMVFESKVLGYTTVKKISSVMLQHTTRISRAMQRKYKRRQIKGPCTVYPVRIIEKKNGKKTTRQAVVVNNQVRLGSMIDVSAGGCALSTSKPLPRGELIKIIFEPRRGTQVVAYGKIVDTRMVTRTKTTLHIMFTRASSKNLNRIYQYIYDFS